MVSSVSSVIEWLTTGVVDNKEANKQTPKTDESHEATSDQLTGEKPRKDLANEPMKETIGKRSHTAGEECLAASAVSTAATKTARTQVSKKAHTQAEKIRQMIMLREHDDRPKDQFLLGQKQKWRKKAWPDGYTEPEPSLKADLKPKKQHKRKAANSVSQVQQAVEQTPVTAPLLPSQPRTSLKRRFDEPSASANMSSDTICVGTRVEITGLVKRPDMNRIAGTCVEYDQTEHRWYVEVVTCKSVKRFRLKKDNLIVIASHSIHPSAEACLHEVQVSNSVQ